MRRKFYTIVRERTKAITIVDEKTRLLPLQSLGEKPAFFMVDSFPYFIDVVQELGNDRPVLSLIGQGETQTSDLYSIWDEAKAHVKAILTYQPHGPYVLGGCSASAVVAYEAAQQLLALGHKVAWLVVFDAPNPDIACDDPSRMGWRELPGWVLGKLRRLIARRASDVWRPGMLVGGQFAPLPARISAALNYRPRAYPGKLLLFKRNCCFTAKGRYLDSQYGWAEVVSGEIQVCVLSADNHLDLFRSEADRALVVQKLHSCFDRVAKSSIDRPQLGAGREASAENLTANEQSLYTGEPFIPAILPKTGDLVR
jgi:thioesterase domain-containing protein